MARHITRSTVAAVLALVVSIGGGSSDAVADEAAHWPQFRGPESLGTSDGTSLPDTWSETENVRWRRDIPGRGWSSPIVWGDKIFITTAINTGEAEEPKRGLYFGGNRTEPPKSVHQWKVLCLDLSTGDVLWERLAHEGVPEGSHHIKNSLASETPVTDGQRVYAYFGNLGMFVYDLNGNPLWSKRFAAYPTRYGWGTAASPVLHGERIYIVNDNDEASFLVALDKSTGEEVWRADRPDEKSNWATPYIWENEVRTEIVTPGTVKTRSYDLQGNLLWEFSGMSSIAIPTPFSKHGLLYVGSGYVLDELRPIYAIRPGARGDITLDQDESSSDAIAWVNRTACSYNPTPVLYGDQIYVLLDRGFFASYDALTGEEIYGKQRIAGAQGFTSSPWAYDGKIFCLDEYGVTFVIEAGPEFKLLHTNELAEEEMAMATPAMAGDKLLIRTDERIYCIQQGAKLAAADAK